MAGDLNQLVQEALAGIIGTGGLPNEEALYQRQAQSELESTFSKGLGISSVSRDALAKARTDAALAAQGAQLSALGQAASVAQQELNRGQQASQFGQSLGLQKKALGQQKSLANQQLLAQGLGLGVGGLAQVAGKTFGPEIQGGLRRMFGLGAPGTQTGLPGEMGGPGQQILSQPGSIDTSGGAGATGALGGMDWGLGDLSGLSSGVTSSIAAPDMLGSLGGLGDLGLWGGFDLSGLIDPSIYSNVPDFSQLWAP